MGLMCAISNVQMQCAPFLKIWRAVPQGDFSEVPLGMASNAVGQGRLGMARWVWGAVASRD